MLRPSIFHENKNSYFPDLFQDFFSDSFFTGMRNDFKTDIIDNGDSYLLKADLPGFKKEDINIELQNDYLTISANHSEDVNEEKDNYIRKERHSSSYSRCFNVSNINKEAIFAEYKDGVLELKLPKMNNNVPSQNRIEIH